MDLHRSRAGAALAALAFCAPAGAACTALDGTYKLESVEKPDGTARSLTEFAADRERSKLFKRDAAPAGPAQGLGGGGVRARPKVTPLAATVRIKSSGDNAQLEFADASGKVLSQAPMGVIPSKWKCVSGRLERRFETMGGLGENIRTDRTEQALFAAPTGELMLVETTTTVGKPAARKVEVRFPRVAKP